MVPLSITQLSIELGTMMTAYAGRNGAGGQSPLYLPFSVLKNYWSTQKISSALAAYQPPIAERPDTIREHFLSVFSLLVYSGKLESLSAFTEYNLRDSSFPQEEIPHAWPNTPTYTELWNSIKQEQWKFFPLIFDPDKMFGQTLSPRYILPITEEEIIKQGESATVYKIKVNEDCTNLHQKTFVMKSYKSRFRQYYEREKTAFTTLETHASPYIIKFHGSFIQKQDPQPPTYNLILEYVDGGNLGDLFAHTRPPQTANDTMRFWRAFVGIFEALFHFHLAKYSFGSHIQGLTHPHHMLLEFDGLTGYSRIHQDIKPENILVTSGPSGLPFDFILKLADFGLSHTRMLENEAEDTAGVDSHGGPTYGAPECSHHAQFTERGKHPITTEADIFSVGCVMSDAAAWVFDGEKGRKDYKDARNSETSTLQTFAGSGHDGCFHDGITALKAVIHMHNIIINGRSTKNADYITPQVLRIVQDHMLVRKDDRWGAKELRERFAGITQDTRIHQDSPVNRTKRPKPPQPIEESKHPPHNTVPTINLPITHIIPRHTNGFSRQPLPIRTTESSFPSQSDPVSVYSQNSPLRNTGTSPQPLSPSQARQLPMLTLQEAKLYREKKKSGPSISRCAEHAISKLKNNLKDRDHIFLIDTSETMYERFDEVADAFQSFAYIAKQIDTNGVELFFSSDPHKPHKGSSSTALRKKFYEQAWDGMTFEDKFGKFVDKIIIPRLRSRLERLSSMFAPKSLNVFVFTDGRWGTDKDKAAGVENPVMRIIEEIKDRKLNRTQVVIQFIRFGEDADGQRYLEYLDDLGKEFDCDFVDTKPVTGNLFEMFIGAIDPDTDQMGESQAGMRSPSSSPVLSRDPGLSYS